MTGYEGNVIYISIHPPPEAAVRAIDGCLNSGADAILIGTYDSGKIPIDLYPSIRRARTQGVPVFGVYQTLENQKGFNLVSDQPYHIFQPEALYSGLIPLYPFPQEVVDMRQKVVAVLKENPEFPPIGPFIVEIDGVSILRELIKGIAVIVGETEDYVERVSRVRQQFSRFDFNKLVNEKTAEALLIYNS